MELGYIVTKGIRKIFNKCAVKDSIVDRHSSLDYGSVMIGSSIGKYSYIGEHTSVLYTNIGNYTSISNYCAIGGGQHPIEWVSTSPVFNNSKSILKTHLSMNNYEPFTQTEIGSDVWIGAKCLIRSGIQIADGAVLGMGSVLTKNIGPYEIWAGNPAKLIRKRFSEDVIELLTKTSWWEWPEEKIRTYAGDFNSINAFLAHLEEER